jgi:cytochrome b
MPPALRPVRVWDLPTRLFHWLLAGCVIASVVSAKIGGNAMEWHFRLGYAVLALLAFRLLWGVMGGRWSRFTSFIYSPAALLRYLRGQSRGNDYFHVGHSPTGALSVFGLLGILAVQASTGLFADDEISNTGPLIKFVTEATSHLLTKWHKTFGQWLIITLVVLHIAAVVFYFIKKRQNLVGPMLTGDKPLADDTPASIDNAKSRALAAVLLAACGSAVAWLVALGG